MVAWLLSPPLLAPLQAVGALQIPNCFKIPFFIAAFPLAKVSPGGKQHRPQGAQTKLAHQNAGSLPQIRQCEGASCCCGEDQGGKKPLRTPITWLTLGVSSFAGRVEEVVV